MVEQFRRSACRPGPSPGSEGDRGGEAQVLQLVADRGDRADVSQADGAVDHDDDAVLEFASRTLATRGELRGAMFQAAVEHVLRVVYTLRGPVD